MKVFGSERYEAPREWVNVCKMLKSSQNIRVNKRKRFKIMEHVALKREKRNTENFIRKT
jgi:hypothetical protein